MNKELVKKAVQEAENELQEKSVQKVKDIVKATLKKIKDLDDEIEKAKEEVKKLEEDRKILRLDIDDLKEGRLDRIEERQKTEPKAKKISVIVVEKEVHHHHHNDWWHQPYRVTYVPYPPATVPVWPITYSTSNNDGCNMTFSGNAINATTTTSGFAVGGNTNLADCFTLNASDAKRNVIGTYSLGNTTVVHLR